MSQVQKLESLLSGILDRSPGDPRWPHRDISGEASLRLQWSDIELLRELCRKEIASAAPMQSQGDPRVPRFEETTVRLVDLKAPRDDDQSPLAEQVDESWVLLYHVVRGWYWARVTDLIPPASSER